MNQPKFKFGDMVRRTEDCEQQLKITVKVIMQDDAGKFWYGKSSAITYGESSLELYQEPQKKKLYAWIDAQDEELRFFKNENNEGWRDCVRAPEYDIEYPVETK